MTSRRLLVPSAARAGNFKYTVAKDPSAMQASTNARTAGHNRLRQRTRRPNCGSAPRTVTNDESLSAANRGPASFQCGGPHRARIAARGETHCDWRGERPVARAPFDDRGPVTLATTGSEAGRPSESGGVRFTE